MVKCRTGMGAARGAAHYSPASNKLVLRVRHACHLSRGQYTRACMVKPCSVQRNRACAVKPNDCVNDKIRNFEHLGMRGKTLATEARRSTV